MKGDFFAKQKNFLHSSLFDGREDERGKKTQLKRGGEKNMSLSPPFPPPQQPELLDPTASAGSLWRASRLAAFRDRAARSGLLPPPLSGDDGAGAVTTKSAAPETAADADADDGKTAAAASEEVASLLARAAELSSELDALASRDRCRRRPRRDPRP